MREASGDRPAAHHTRGCDGGAYRQPPPLPALWDLTSLNLTAPEYRNRHIAALAMPALIRRIEHPATPFDADNRMRQAQAMLRLDVTRPYGDSMRRTSAQVQARMLIDLSAQDRMVTPGPAENFSHLAPAGRARIFSPRSDCGHSAAGCEPARLNRAIQHFLAEPCMKSARCSRNLK